MGGPWALGGGIFLTFQACSLNQATGRKGPHPSIWPVPASARGHPHLPDYMRVAREEAGLGAEGPCPGWVTLQAFSLSPTLTPQSGLSTALFVLRSQSDNLSFSEVWDKALSREL